MDNSLKSALKKAKLKQLLKIILTSVIVLVILLPILYKTGNFFAAKNSSKLHDRLFLHNEIAEPNIQIDSQVTSNGSMFGGKIVTNRSKNINGYIEEWSTLTSSYDWFRVNIDHNELTPGTYWTDEETYQYDRQTKSKVATFYHPDIKNYYNGVQNELGQVAEMDDYVVEVALSFDQPYTLKEIQKNIPDNLNIVWLYMASPIVDEEDGPTGTQVYGFNPTDSPKDDYYNFIESLKQYDASDNNETIQEFLKENENKPFSKVEVLGVMLTGQAKNFKELEGLNFIRGSSVGETAKMVPYIKPEK